MPRSPEELRGLVEDALEQLELWPQLHGQAESVRYSITVGGKRVRPGDRVSRPRRQPASTPEVALPAGCALELVHTFSLVHDDLPVARQRRGAARAAVDVEAVRRGGRDSRRRRAARRGVPPRDVVRHAARRARARAGDARDDRRPVPRHHRHRARRGDAAQPEDGRLVHGRGRARALGRPRSRGRAGGLARVRRTSSACCSRSSTTSSTATATSSRHGVEGARRLADEAADRARERLGEVDADTSVLREIVDGLAVRTA